VLSFFSFLSPTCGAGSSASLLHPPPPFSPRRAASHRPARAAAARERMGRPGQRAGAHAELARARDPVWEIPRRGVSPFAPAGDAKGAMAATAGQPRRHLRLGAQSRGVVAALPSGCLDQYLHPEAEPPRAPHQPLGVFPLSSDLRPRGETRRSRKSEGGGRRSLAPRRRRRAVAGDHSRTGGARRVVAEGGGRPRREGTLKRSKKPTATTYVDAVHHYTAPPDFPETATTTPPTRREHLAAIFSFPHPWMLSCDGPEMSRRVTVSTA
jgi:hypothetical protein